MSKKLPKKVEIILFDSYLQAIKNSVGSNLFRNLYALVDGQRMDIYKDGGLSCPVFLSSILYLYKLSFDVHGTVGGTLKDMEKFGWHIIEDVRPGAILLWEAKATEDPTNDIYPSHRHLGFYIGDSKAISTSARARQPIEHHWTYGEENGKPTRKIEAIYWHDKLG